jgi:hypothetical protein
MHKHFHNTIQLTQPELDLFEEKAGNQDKQILDIFKERDGQWLTPFHIHSILKAKTGKDIPITSVRRAITYLCKSQEILKSVDATRKGAYGVKNHTWTLNRKSA